MQLKKLGYSADKVKVVVTSHTHLDHGGNMEMFPNAIHVIQKKELYPGLVAGEVPGPHPRWRVRSWPI